MRGMIAKESHALVTRRSGHQLLRIAYVVFRATGSAVERMGSRSPSSVCGSSSPNSTPVLCKGLPQPILLISVIYLAEFTHGAVTLSRPAGGVSLGVPIAASGWLCANGGSPPPGLPGAGIVSGPLWT